MLPPFPEFTPVTSTPQLKVKITRKQVSVDVSKAWKDTCELRMTPLKHEMSGTVMQNEGVANCSEELMLWSL